MKEGDHVRIKPCEGQMSPWSGFARNGILMRISRIAPHDPHRIQVVDPFSDRKGWFNEAELAYSKPPEATGS